MSTPCQKPTQCFGNKRHNSSDGLGGPQLATYARYNVLLEPGWLKTTVKLDLAPEAVAKIAAMDDPNNMRHLTDIGGLAAKEQLKPEHFPPCFDVK